MKNTLKLRQIKYGTDGVSRSWGTALVCFGEGRNEHSLGKVRAVVKLHDGDVFNEKTGRDLVFNILHRKAITKIIHSANMTHRSLLNQIGEVATLIQELSVEEKELEAEFKTL